MKSDKIGSYYKSKGIRGKREENDNIILCLYGVWILGNRKNDLCQ